MIELKDDSLKVDDVLIPFINYKIEGTVNGYRAYLYNNGEIEIEEGVVISKEEIKENPKFKIVNLKNKINLDLDICPECRDQLIVGKDICTFDICTYNDEEINVKITISARIQKSKKTTLSDIEESLSLSSNSSIDEYIIDSVELD